MTDIPVWGVDLTATSVRAVKLALSHDGKVRAEAWDVVDFAEDVENAHSLSRYDAQKRAIHSFLRHHDIAGCLVFASLRGEAAFNRTVTIPQTADQNLDRLLEYEAQQQIPYPLDDVHWDRRVVGIREGGDVVATIYAVQRTIVSERLAKLELAGLPVDGLVLRPVALHNFCARERLLEPGSVVVDVDYAGCQVLIVHDDQVTFRSLAIGSSELVTRLSTALRVDHRVALRIATGQASPAPAQKDVVAKLRDDVAREIGAEALQAIRAYSAAHEGFVATNVVLFETHPSVPPMSEVLKTELRMPVFRAKGFHSIEIEPGIVSAGIQENFAGLARAVGLALQGLGKAEVALELYPKELRRTFKPKPVGWLVCAALLVGIVLVGHAQRKSLASGLREAVDTGARLEQDLAGRSRDAVDQLLADDPVALVAATWERRAAARAGALPWYDALVAAIHERRSKGETPLLVGFSWGDVAGRAPDAQSGQLVLAAPETRPEAEIDAGLSDLVSSLLGKAGLREAKPSSAWSAAALSARAPDAPDTRVVRHRFRHVAFDLSWRTP